MSLDHAAPLIVVESVDWDDVSAVALRDAMRAEMRLRYADRIATKEGIAADMTVSAESVAWTGVAYAETTAVADRLPVGHVALRWLDADRTELELKRMYVAPSHRGHGVSRALIRAVDDAAARLGARRIVLQTGDRQPDAVHVYERAGYTRIPIFAPYEALTYSSCFAKTIAPTSSEPGR